MPRKRRTSSKAGSSKAGSSKAVSSKAGSSKAGSSNDGPTIDSLNNEIRDLRGIVEDGLINQKEATEYHVELLLVRIHDNKIEHRQLIDDNKIEHRQLIDDNKIEHRQLIDDNKIEHRQLIDANIQRIDTIIEGIKVLHAAFGQANQLRKANQLIKATTRSHTKTPPISGEAFDMYQG